MGLTVRRDRGVLTLVLDTPGSDVNILDRDTADELAAVVEGVSPGSVRAVVLASAKPTSFVNGVGLMLASAVRSEADAYAATEGVRRAYRAVRECPVTTIAAIRGNCFGCGVELALECDYRLAADSFWTSFYMTEIREYLFVPAFGATQNTPRLLGLAKAIDFVLWGERWGAREAKRHGLVDAVFPEKAFDERVATFVDRRAGRKARRAPKAVSGAAAAVRRAEERIARLPPDYRPTYRDCLKLLAAATRAPDFEAELAASARSVLTPAAKAATGFFFLRQTVAVLAAQGDAPLRGRLAVAPGPALAALRRELSARPVDVVRDAAADFRLVAKRGAGATVRDVTTRTEWIAREAWPDSPLALYHPPCASSVLVEVVARPEAGPLGATLGAILARAGYAVVSTKGEGPVMNDFLCAFFAPLVARILAGADPARLDRALGDFGFTRRASAWRGLVSGRALASLVRPALPEALGDVSVAELARAAQTLFREPARRARERPADPLVVPGVALALLGTAERALARGVLRHPAQADLIARDVIDFPLQHTSLCRYLRHARVAELLDVPGLSSVAASADLASARRYLESRREFYLQAR